MTDIPISKELKEMIESEWFKKILKQLGYSLIKQKPYIKMLPCICGCKRHVVWYKNDEQRISCERCGRDGPFAKTNEAARIGWNSMIEQETKMQDYILNDEKLIEELSCEQSNAATSARKDT